MKRSVLLGCVGFAAVIPSLLNASDILIINGSGSSSLAGPLGAAGFGVIQDLYRPGAIADHLSVPNNITEIWIWNDGSFGNTFSPADPSRAFDAADQSALTTFNATHKNWIFDGLSWRANGNPDEQNFTKNEGLGLAGAGGGIVLGADDASGAAIVQHVNQVASWFNFNAWDGVYSTPPGSQHEGGTFFTTPNPVDPTQVVGTTTYSEVPNGLQPNGLFLGTAVFGQGTPYPGFGSPDLPSEVFNGVSYDHVNHVVTTTISGASINPNPTSIPEATPSLAVFGAALAGLVGAKVWAARKTRAV